LREDLSEKNTDAIEAAIIIRNYCAGRTVMPGWISR
jgi:hypothetical protein